MHVAVVVRNRVGTDVLEYIKQFNATIAVVTQSPDAQRRDC